MISLTNNHKDFSSRQHSEITARRCFIKKLPLIISKNSQESRRLFLSCKLNLIKNTAVHVFFCKFRNILKNISFVKHIRTAASDHS